MRIIKCIITEYTPRCNKNREFMRGKAFSFGKNSFCSACGKAAAVRTAAISALCGGSRLHHANRGSAALRSVRLVPRYQNNNLGWCEAPQAVEHPRETENPPGAPSGRRLRLETQKPPVERLFPPSGGVSRGSVRVGGETFLLPSYGFSFGYKRKGVSIAPLTEAQRNIVGQ